MTGFSICELHSVLIMPEYASTDFWTHVGFYICQDSEYGRVLNMQELHRVLNMSQYSWICMSRTCMPEYVWIDDNRQGSEQVSYNT